MVTYLAWETHRDPKWFCLFGFVGSTVIVLIEYASNVIASRKIMLAFVGWMLGLICAQIFYPTFGWLVGLVFSVFDSLKPMSLNAATQPPPPPLRITPETARFVCHMLFGYFGLVLALRHADWFRLGNLKFYLANPSDRPKVLDSSVIIDGRILDLIALGMLEGPVLAPYFVINEVQMLSDAPDDHRRSRGKRGLEVLDKLRVQCPGLDTVDTDYPDLAGVDDKLVRLCRELNADLLTNDANLQKVAQLHQIKTVNLNELAAALRQTVYVGDTIFVRIVKPGKEPGQGVGYLDDGSMIVVDEAEHLTGKEIEIEVSGMLQNPSGRMIFGRPAEFARGRAAG
jgi:uncharacterized protein YacL